MRVRARARATGLVRARLGVGAGVRIGLRVGARARLLRLYSQPLSSLHLRPPRLPRFRWVGVGVGG